MTNEYRSVNNQSLIGTVKSSEILNLVRFISNIAIEPWLYYSLFPLINLNQLSNITNIYLFLFVLPLCYCLSSGRHPPKLPPSILGLSWWRFPPTAKQTADSSCLMCRCSASMEVEDREEEGRFPAHGSFLQQQTWYLFCWYGSSNHPLKFHSDESWLLPPLGFCSSRFMHGIR